MPRPLLVVDTPSMLYRAFFALPKTIKGTIDGKRASVNALLGTANLVLREIEAHEPRAVVLCFGPDAAEYRVELLPAYHADRPPMPDELGPQFAACRDLFPRFGWQIAESENLEADDILGSLAKAETEAGGTTLVMTGDRDMFQTASDTVTVLYVSTGKQGGQLVDPAEVKKRYGIPPELVPDFIALRGDPSDGIPGGKGIGEKTAADLLKRHGSLDAVLDNAIREATPRLRGTLTEQRQELLEFREIARLQDAKVKRPPDRETDFAAAAGAARDYGMNGLADRLEKAAG
ncbi:MAG: 5'-3' exonuclease [Thermoleophilales bacterium]|nr:5'-3' exonuclease [Thermoleophilales bacterium]